MKHKSLTNSMEHSPSRETNQFSASQKIPGILCYPEVYYHIYKSPPLFPILSQINPVLAPIPSDFYDEQITRLEQSYRVFVCLIVCYIETSILRKPRRNLGCSNAEMEGVILDGTKYTPRHEQQC